MKRKSKAKPIKLDEEEKELLSSFEKKRMENR
jgi:hypothetical protein